MSALSTPDVRGGELTFDDFVTASAGSLLRTAVFLVYDRHLAEDLVQLAYERVARRWRRLASGNPEAYARRIIVNLAIDERKRRRDLPVGSVTEIERLAAAPAGAARTGPSGGLLDDALEDALRALPAKQRAVLVLRYWCDLSEQDIADTLGVSRGTVKSHAARAMAALREHMAAEDPRTAEEGEGRADGR